MKRTTLIFSGMISLVLLLFSPVHAAVDIQAELVEVQTQKSFLLFVKSPGDIAEYTLDGFIPELAGIPEEASATHANLQAADSAMDLLKVVGGEQQVVTFVTREVFEQLDDGDITILRNWALSGVVMVTLAEDGEYLKNRLGIGSVSRGLVEDAEPYTDTDLFILLAGSETAYREVTLSVRELTAGEVMVQVLSWVMGVRQELAEEADRSGGAWDAHYTREWKGKMNDGSGTYRFMVTVHKLNDNSDAKDWYRVGIDMTSSIISSDCGTFWPTSCGYYTSGMDLTAAIESGSLYDYAPTGTISGGSRGFSVGGGLDANLSSDAVGVGGNMSAAYSVSYNFSDVTVRDKTDFVDNRAQWECELMGPEYTWYPFVTPPANVARNTYTWKPVFIVETSQDHAFTLNLTPVIKQLKDDIAYYFFVASVSRKGAYWPARSLRLTINP